MNASELDFQQIYETFQPKIHRYLTRLAGESEAEDLTQETFVKAHRALENFRGESQLSTWIYRIAANTAMDKLRSPSFQQVAQFNLSDDSIEDDQAGNAGRVVLVKEEKPPAEKKLI